MHNTTKQQKESKESKRERSRQQQRENSSKTDDEMNDLILTEGQHGDQGQDNEDTYDHRLQEIKLKLEKLLALFPLFEDLKDQFASLKENTQL